MDELKTMTADQAIDVLQKAIKQGGTFGFVEEFQTAVNLAIKSLNRRAAPENKPQTHCVECTNYRPYGDKGRGKCLYYNERFDVGDNHFCGYAVPKARKPEQEEK